jgi:protein-S-isoprenylcysteine O-methyltransferase Ste14
MNAKGSLFSFLGAVVGLIGLISSGELFDRNVITIGLQIVAALLMIWARITFGMRSFHAAANPTEGGLVTNGPYALVRNPIYAAVILFSWASVGAFPNPTSIGLRLVVTAGMLVRIVFEERELRAHFKDQYAAYRQRVKRLIPFVF